MDLLFENNNYTIISTPIRNSEPHLQSTEFVFAENFIFRKVDFSTGK
jgi:hypothetical protein